MSPAVLAALISVLPELISLVQTMIAQYNAGNSMYTESDILAMQAEIAKLVKTANAAINAQMAAVVAPTTPTASTSASG